LTAQDQKIVEAWIIGGQKKKRRTGGGEASAAFEGVHSPPRAGRGEAARAAPLPLEPPAGAPRGAATRRAPASLLLAVAPRPRAWCDLRRRPAHARWGRRPYCVARARAPESRAAHASRRRGARRARRPRGARGRGASLPRPRRRVAELRANPRVDGRGAPRRG